MKLAFGAAAQNRGHVRNQKTHAVWCWDEAQSLPLLGQNDSYDRRQEVSKLPGRSTFTSSPFQKAAVMIRI